MSLYSLVLIFLLIFACVAVALVVALQALETRRKKQVNDLLSNVARLPVTAPGILKEPETQRAPLLERIGVLRAIEAVDARIKQAGLEWTPERFAVLTLLAGATGAVVGLALPVALPAAWRAAGVGALCASVPWIKLTRARNQRMAAFEQQFPDALDFLARSMRAGHAFTISLEMMANEMKDPLAREFRTLFNEQNLGAPLDVALRNLTIRIPLIDVRFFASAVMLQKQTGGNLNEVLARLAYVIRERFRLKGQVRAASAHGRITASILGALPVATFCSLLLIAPQYIKGMLNDQDGRYMLAGCVVAQVVGRFFIRRIIDIKV